MKSAKGDTKNQGKEMQEIITFYSENWKETMRDLE
jgi:hypothetical protein